MNLRISSKLKLVRVFLILGFFSILFFGLSNIVSANDSLVVENVEFSYTFAETLDISALIPESNAIENLTIVIEPENQQARQIQAVINKDHTIISTLDLQTNAFVPFTRIYVWFEAEMNNGVIVNSPSYWFDYLDNRFDWKSNSSNLFNIFWVNGDSAYGQKCQQIARAGLERATQLLPVIPQTPVEIYIYPDETSLQSVFTLDSQIWVNGHAFLNANRILVADTQPLEDITDIERTIPHEIMHLLQFQVTGTNYQLAPSWLTEGLSTQTELYANPEYQRKLTDGLQNNSLTPLSNLCSGLPPDSAHLIVDYAQSSSVVEYIQRQFGNQVFLTMLQNASSGMDCEKNTFSSLGISIQQLERDWRDSMLNKNSGNSSNKISSILWIGIPVVLLITGVCILIIRRKKLKAAQ